MQYIQKFKTMNFNLGVQYIKVNETENYNKTQKCQIFGNLLQNKINKLLTFVNCYEGPHLQTL